MTIWSWTCVFIPILQTKKLIVRIRDFPSVMWLGNWIWDCPPKSRELPQSLPLHPLFPERDPLRRASPDPWGAQPAPLPAVCIPLPCFVSLLLLISACASYLFLCLSSLPWECKFQESRISHSLVTTGFSAPITGLQSKSSAVKVYWMDEINEISRCFPPKSIAQVTNTKLLISSWIICNVNTVYILVYSQLPQYVWIPS